jgi:membrane-associated protease RseP (regulator of RpoE activity)
LNSTLVYSLITIWCASYIHVLAMFAGARLLGVRVILVSLGFGPQLFAIGRVSVRLIPAGGFVRMHDNREDPVDQRPDAYDEQPRLVRVLLNLSGCAALVGLVVAMRGGQGWQSFLHGFEQILAGVISPPDTGVGLVDGYVLRVDAGGFLAAFSILTAKIAAFNLLPVPILNGGQALQELLLPRSWISEATDMRLKQVGLTLLCILCAVWLWIVCKAAFATIPP